MGGVFDAEASGKSTVVAELSGRLSALSGKLESATQKADLTLQEPTRPPSKVPEAIQFIIDHLKRGPVINTSTVEAFKKAAKIYDEEIRELRTHKTKAESNIKSHSAMKKLRPQLTSSQLKIDHYAATVHQVFDRLTTLPAQLSNRKHDTEATRIAYIQLVQDAADEFKKEEDIASIYRELKRFEAQKGLLNTRPQLSMREEIYEGAISNLETKIGGLRAQLDERERALSSNGSWSPGEGDTGSGISDTPGEVAAPPPPGAGVLNGFDYGTGESKSDEDINNEDIGMGLRGGMGDGVPQIESVDEDSFVIY